MAFWQRNPTKKDDRTIKKINSLLSGLEKQPIYEQRKRIAKAQALLPKIKDRDRRTLIQRHVFSPHLRHLTPDEIEEAKKQGIPEDQAKRMMKVRTQKDRIDEKIINAKNKRRQPQEEIDKLLKERIAKKQQEYSKLQEEEREHTRRLTESQQKQLAKLISQLQQTKPSDSAKARRLLSEISGISPTTAKRIRTDNLTRSYRRMIELRKRELPKLQEKLKLALQESLPSQYTDQEAINLAGKYPEYRPTGNRTKDIQQARELLMQVRKAKLQQITSQIENAKKQYETIVRSREVQQDLGLDVLRATTMERASIPKSKMERLRKEAGKAQLVSQSSLPEVSLEKHERIKRKMISTNLPRKDVSFDHHVDRILKGRTIEEILGIDTKDLNADQIITRYEEITADLLRTQGSKAREAQKKIQKVFAPIVDYIEDNPDTNIHDLVSQQKLKEITADYNRRQLEKVRKGRREYYKHPTWRDAYRQIPKELKKKLTLEHMQREDMKRRKQVLRAMATAGKVPLGLAGSGGYAVGKFFGSKALSGAKTTGRWVDRKVLESNPVGRKLKSGSKRVGRGIRGFGRNIRGFGQWTVSSYDQMSEKILNSRVISREFKQHDRVKSYDSIGAFKLRTNKKKSILAHYQKLREKKGKKKTRLNPFTLLKAAWDVVVQPQIDRIKGIFHTAKEFVATYSGFRRAMRIKNAIGDKITGVKTNLMGGRVGRTLIRANRALNGARAVLRATQNGFKTGGLTLATGAILTGGFSAPVVALGAMSGLAGFGSKIVSDTLNSKVVSPIKWVADQQQRFGIAKYIDIETGKFTQNFIPKSKLLMISNSINSAIYGANIGYLAGILIPGLNPLVGATLGAVSFGGAKFGSQWIVNKILMKLSNVSSESWLGRFINVAGTMPVFSAGSLMTSIPWIDSQIRGIRAGGFDFIKDQYFNFSFNDFQILNTALNWLSGINTIQSAWSLGSWAIGATGVASRAFGAIGAGMIAGGITGSLIAGALGLSVGTGAIIGGMVGGVIGGVLLGSIIPVWGHFIGSWIGSTIGKLVGSVIDTILDKAKDIDVLGQALSTLFGALSFFKGIFDFFRTLTEKFDASKSISFALTLLFGLPVLTKIIDSNSILTNSPDDLSQESEQVDSIDLNSKPNLVFANNNNSLVQGESSTKQIIDCLKTKNHKIYNPKRSIITKIQKEKTTNTYTIHTKNFIFKNIYNINLNLEKYSTINSQILIGDCK